MGWLAVGVVVAVVGYVRAVNDDYASTERIVELVVTLESAYLGVVLCAFRRRTELRHRLAGGTLVDALARYFFACVGAVLVPILCTSVVGLVGSRFGFRFFWGDAGGLGLAGGALVLPFATGFYVFFWKEVVQ